MFVLVSVFRRSELESSVNGPIVPSKRTFVASEYQARKVTLLGRSVDEREGSGPEVPRGQTSRRL